MEGLAKHQRPMDKREEHQPVSAKNLLSVGEYHIPKTTMHFTERISRRKLVSLQKNWKNICWKNKDEKEIEAYYKRFKGLLRKLTKNETGNFYLDVSYAQKDYGFGRDETTCKLSAQSMPRIFRNYLVSDFVVDYDIVNCHPVILVQVCEKMGIPCPMLLYYVDNREEVLAGLHEDRTTAKLNIIKCINGATGLAGLKKMEKEIAKVSTILMSDVRFKHIRKVACDKRRSRNKHYPNERGRFMAFFLQDIEHHLLLACVAFCEKHGIAIESLIYDGFTARKEDVVDLELLSDYVFECTGYRVAFLTKPMETSLAFEDSDDDVVISYVDVKREFEEHCCKVMSLSALYDNDKLISKKDALFRYQNLFYDGFDEDKGEYKQMLFINTWLSDPSMRTFEDIGCFPPPLVVPENVYNTWKPFEIDGYDREGRGDSSLLERHLLEVVASGNQEHFHWLLNHFAKILQQPGSKTNNCVVVVGKKGAGKTTVGEILMRLVGVDKYCEIKDPENQLFGRFSNVWRGCSVVTLDDFSVVDLKREKARAFLPMITSARDITERKGVEGHTGTQYANFFVYHEKISCVKIEPGNRRFALFKVDNKYRKDKDYFNELYKSMDDKDNMRAFYDKLMEWEIEELGLPVSDASRVAEESNLAVVPAFLHDMSWQIRQALEVREVTDEGFIKSPSGRPFVLQRVLYTYIKTLRSKNA